MEAVAHARGLRKYDFNDCCNAASLSSTPPTPTPPPSTATVVVGQHGPPDVEIGVGRP